MAGALNFDLEPRFYGDFSVNNLASRNFCIVSGYFSYDAASSSALTVTTALVGLTDIIGFVAASKGGVMWSFSPSTDTLQPVAGCYYSATGVCYFTSTASLDVASITSIPFLCWGYK